MATELEDLRVLKIAEGIADAIWAQAGQWNEFARDTIGKQIVRAVDSIGANIAEGFGRFNFGEKLQFLYYARGSLFETRYWLKRTSVRNLMLDSDVTNYTTQLADLARQLNAFASSLKSQRRNEHHPNTLHEATAEYITWVGDNNRPLFTETELNWLQNLQSPISSL